MLMNQQLKEAMKSVAEYDQYIGRFAEALNAASEIIFSDINPVLYIGANLTYHESCDEYSKYPFVLFDFFNEEFKVIPDEYLDVIPHVRKFERLVSLNMTNMNLRRDDFSEFLRLNVGRRHMVFTVATYPDNMSADESYLTVAFNKDEADQVQVIKTIDIANWGMDLPENVKNEIRLAEQDSETGVLKLSDETSRLISTDLPWPWLKGKVLKFVMSGSELLRQVAPDPDKELIVSELKVSHDTPIFDIG